MDSAQKTLIGIASVSQSVVNILDRCVGPKTVESLRMDKIVVGSRTVLEALNKIFLFKEGNADDRLMDWLNSEEPQACLRTLKQMEEILNRMPEHGVKSFFKPSRPTHTQDKDNEAIRLFQMRKVYFHFLLSAEIWNHEYGVQQQPQGTQLDVTDIGKAVDRTIMMEEKLGANLESLDSILGWLNAWNSRGTHERTLLLRQPDTCTWLPKSSAYQKWRNKEYSFLWLHGKPGAGKSVLAASMIDGLKDTLQDSEVLAYFYCDFRDERSTSAAEVLRSLLSQLLRQLRRHAVDPGDLIDELIEEKDGGASTLSNVAFLTRHVSRAVKRYHEPPFLIIDAVDECKDIEELLDALVKLQRGGVRLLAISRPLQVIKDSFSGLPFIDMEAMSYEISVDIRLHVTRELDSHRRLRIMDASLKDEMYSALCKKAGGMFRWVQCQLDNLKQCVTVIELREALINLPDDLDTTYQRILSEIDRTKREGKLARRALDWLVVAFKPLQLSQIMASLSIDLERQVLDRDSGPVHGFALLDALGSLVIYDEVTDIVILSHFSVKEFLVAESTRKKYPAYHVDQHAAHTRLALVCLYYFGISFRYHQQLGGHDAPRETSIQIGRDNSKSTASSTEKFSAPSSQLESHLLQYVLSAGFRHLAHVNPRNKAIFRALKAFELDARQHPLWWKQLCESTDCYPFSYLASEHDLALCILIAFAPEPLFRLFIGRTKLQPKVGTNPLIYAVYLGKMEHAKTLLLGGANPNCKGWNIGDSRQLLPLEVAVERGDCPMVHLFLDKGSHVPHVLFESALMKNFCRIQARIVSRLLQTDEFVEWATSVQNEGLLLRALDHRRYRVIGHRPSEQDIDIIRRRLIQTGCNLPDCFDVESLRYAVSAGHVSTVKNMLSLNVTFPSNIILNASWSTGSNSTMIRLLLGAGCEVDVTSLSGNNAIHQVLMCRLSEDDGFESVQVLVDAGCDPSARNLAGETPLHLAARFGYVSVAKYLLSLQVHLPPDILLEASQTAMIRYLICQGAEVHIPAANGDTPLHLCLRDCQPPITSSDEYLERFEILIGAGCNPCLPNSFGETAFHVAAEHGHLPVVQHLLSASVPMPSGILLSMVGSFRPTVTPVIKYLIVKGADVHATRAGGDTLLHLAMTTNPEAECLTRVKILVNAGCDPCACNLSGRTPFHDAAAQAYVLVMEYLLTLGVSVPSDVVLAQFDWTQYPIRPRFSLATRFLLDKGADVLVTKDGNTLLHLAARLSREYEALKVARLLVHAGCNPSTRNSKHELPLHIAAQKGYTSVVDYFLSLSISLPPDILLAASKASSGKASIIPYLIEKGADISVVTTDGDTPLHLVVTEDNQDDCLESVKILVDAGCDPGAQNSTKETIMHVAARCGSIPVLEYLLSQGVALPGDSLVTLAPSTICFLSGRGIDVCCVTAGTCAELMHRALDYPHGKDCLACAQILVGAGWNPSARNSSGETPIHIAARRGHISVVQYLLSQCILPPDLLLAAVTSHGHLPDHTLIRLLIREGACVNTTAANGDTPLHCVLRCNFRVIVQEYAYYTWTHSWKLVEILLDCGADAFARNVDGQTPVEIAETNGPFFKENFLRLVRNAHCIQSELISLSKSLSSI